MSVSSHQVLAATLILSENSRVLDAESRLKSANLGRNRLKSAKIQPKVTQAD